MPLPLIVGFALWLHVLRWLGGNSDATAISITHANVHNLMTVRQPEAA